MMAISISITNHLYKTTYAGSNTRYNISKQIILLYQLL